MARRERLERIEVRAYRIPTDAPEGDGTLRWDSTTLVVVHAHGGGATGLGYTYASKAAAGLIEDPLTSAVLQRDVFDVPGAHAAMRRALRNVGIPGAGMMALSAVDVALWDLKARILDVPLASLLGRAQERVLAYGSGGFTTYDNAGLEKQLRGWVEQGFSRVKMKVGASPDEDLGRVRVARAAVGQKPALMVDANGAYTATQARASAERYAEFGVDWLEEPVSSDDLRGLGAIRAHAPAGLRITAGEYGDTPLYFRRMLEAGAVDVLQADATRCGGVTGFLECAAQARAQQTPLSAHCAPALHTTLGCAGLGCESVEYFHDHVRIEALLFDGAPSPREGWLAPDLSRSGLGLELKQRDAERFRF
ncbi:MAG: mandelate racemase [Deltaproteobacteria bacterium]|nr:mandelate racemase [Deltaproteobacteria bacterium]